MIAFVRHGQTALNRDGRLQGRSDATLSEVGWEQARAVARMLTDARVARVVASPLCRAVETATAIAAPHDVAVETDDRLIELDYGAWDGLALSEIPARDWAAWRANPEFAPPGGERLVDVTARVASFTADMLGDDLVVAVSHVSPIKAAVCCALGVDERATWRMHLELASVTRIGRRPDGSAFLRSYNELA